MNPKGGSAVLPVVSAVAALMATTVRADWYSVSLHPGPPNNFTAAVAGGNGMQGGFAQARRPPFDLLIQHPVLWEGTAGSMRDILPTGGGYEAGRVNAISGNRQVGLVGGAAGAHAALWHGTAESFVSLDFSGQLYLGTNAVGTAGDQIVGSAYSRVTGYEHAILWNAETLAWRDLNPANGAVSYAQCTDGELQGGRVRLVGGGYYHAALWSGTAASFVDLNPPARLESRVNGMTVGVQAGMTRVAGSNPVPALWHGTAESYISMIPIGFDFGEIYATFGGVHVGYVYPTQGAGVAGLWLGDDPNSFINLNNFLGQDFAGSSALAISQFQGRYYITGTGVRASTGEVEAVLWVLDSVPTPGSATLLGMGIWFGTRRRR